MKPPVKEVYGALWDHYGPQHWWPADSALEMMIGAILTQNTAWTNVDKALQKLRENRAIDLHALQNIPREKLMEWIRPAGFFNQKSRSIKEMVNTIHDRFDGSLEQLFSLDTKALRKELLSWAGVGPETADCMILYAAKKPVFVIDAYTRRICNRHNWIDEKSSYDKVAELFTHSLPTDTTLFNEYHALIVQVCKDFCSSRNPKCATCPLKGYLPADHTDLHR